ncbi:MAG: hypothetical protein IT258_23030 [Saprospiraceae bacterium]|nr:hypothetical protein [Saprospiraceae bacterium]
MNSRFLGALLLVILFSACQTTPFWKDDTTPDGGTQWDSIDFKMEPYVQGMLATPFELYAISENSFARLNSDLEVIERRLFLRPSMSNSLPALSENSLVRLIANDQGRQIIEFHLTRNATEVHNVLVDTLPAPAGNSFEIESLTAAPVGAFSNDGTLFLMPAKVVPARYFSLFLFEVRHNAQHNSFASVKIIKRIDLTDVVANAEGVVKSVKFLNGNFYVATQQGAWRITPAGVAVRKFPQWKEDCFTFQGDLYATGAYEFDLDKSIDNGLTWERMNIASELQHVVVADSMIFTQPVLGQVFSVMPKDLKKKKEIDYPAAVKPTSPYFFGLVYFKDRYYFSSDEMIFATDRVVVD